ncbi:MAG: glycosyltransferase [Burkholderiaceae bacterium]
MIGESQTLISIVMPVYNTGRILLDSVRSVVDQQLFAAQPSSYWELLLVDDASTDRATLAALDEARSMSPSVRVLQNNRSKGVAGARNTGVFAARGTWIGFLDSDDLLYTDFLSRQYDAFAHMPHALWRAAHFHLGDENAIAKLVPVSQRSPCLYRRIAGDYTEGRVSMLHRPVDVLLRCGCVGIMTVQVDRGLIQALGGFNETLGCAEDYDLWLRLAKTEDLYVSPIDSGIYRVRSGSLTKSGQPMYYCEDRMLLAAKDDTGFDAFKSDIDTRLRMVYTKFCFHFRQNRQFGEAARFAVKLIRLRPTLTEGWRHLLAAVLRV